MIAARPPIYVPSSVGREALHELNQVPWGELTHAYGTGSLGPQLWEDVAAMLRRFGDTDQRALDDGVHAFFSNLCHQGTIYEATAYAVPFLAAFVAGTDLSPAHADAFIVMLASIGVAASFEAPHGSHAGSWGEGVAQLTQQALRDCVGLLRSAAQRNQRLRGVADAITAMVRDDKPSAEAAALLDRIVREIEGTLE